MKLKTDEKQWQELTPQSKRFLSIWKERKYNKQELELTLGEIIELFIALTPNLHKEHSDGRFFNQALINAESAISWEGEELIDILFYELKIELQKRLSQSKVLDNF